MKTMLAVVVALVVLTPTALHAAPHRAHATKAVAKHPKAKPARAPRAKTAVAEPEAKPRVADKVEPEPAVDHAVAKTAVAQAHDAEEPPARKRPK